MKNAIGEKYRLVMVFVIVIFMINSAIVVANVSKNKKGMQNINNIYFENSEGRVSVTITIGSYDIKNTEYGDEIFIEDFGRLPSPGKPNLPSKIFAVAIPPGAEVLEVTFNTGEGVTLPGVYDISPVPLSRVIGAEDPLIYEQDKKMYEDNYNLVYGSVKQYPENVGEFIRTAGYRKYNLVDVQITPFTYHPLSGQLMYYPEVTIDIRYTFSEKKTDILVDDLVRTERIAEEIILNYDQTKSWYPKGNQMGRGLYDFVIITLDSLISSVTPLVNWEISKGRTVQVVTTAWINSNYDGYDLAEKMRNFLREKYPSNEWGIEDVLLVGHYDDVPMRLCSQNVGYGQPETDLYYAELSLPDNESWDADKDHKYGEDSDPIDFYSEVNVGRIPWSESDTVLQICKKSVAYEQNDDLNFKKNILLLGAYFWADTDNAVLMEYKVNETLHPWMSDWIMTRMYEKNNNYWSSYDCDYPLLHSNVMSVWPAGKYAFVNWAGHGSPYSTHIYGLGAPAFIRSSDCPFLNDDYPAIIFADACSNSDTEYLNIGQAMMKQGAVGFLGATKVAYGMGEWDDPVDGSSQSFDYYFTTFITSGEYTQGEAHQKALREMYTNGLWYKIKFEMFEWGALWGNPDLGIDPIVDLPVIEIGDIKSGLSKIDIIVSNVGTADATNVYWSIAIKGGVFGLVDNTTKGIIETLAIGDEATIQTDKIVFGLGYTEIIILTTFNRAKTEGGILLGPFLIIKNNHCINDGLP